MEIPAFLYIYKKNTMEAIRNFNQLTRHIIDNGKRKRIAVACPHDSHSADAIKLATERGIATFTLFGDEAKMRGLGCFDNLPVTMVHEPDCDRAAALAVKAIRDGEADILMKGSINTDNILKAILNKEQGILPKGNVLSHVTVMEVPGREKLIFMSDVAVIPYPSFEQKQQMIRYVLKCCRDFGIERPKLGLIHFTEKVNPKFPNSTDYVQLAAMARDGEFGDCVLDGPIDVRTAFDDETARIKGINSPLGGDADGLIFPNIESGNVFYKTMTYFCHAEIAGVVLGAQCPVVIASRGDSIVSKYSSIALACAIS